MYEGSVEASHPYDMSCDELHEQSGTTAQVGAMLKINWNAYVMCLPPAN